MSRTTDLVFIYPAEADDWPDDDGDPRCAPFEDMYSRHHRWPIAPTGQTPGKTSGTIVYHTGVNYLSSEFIGEVTARKWPDGTVLYLFDEHDDCPTVTVWPGQEGRRWVRGTTRPAPDVGAQPTPTATASTTTAGTPTANVTTEGPNDEHA